MRARSRVDDVDAREVPSRDTERQSDEGAIGARDLEAHALDADGAIAAALVPAHEHPESAPQRDRVGTRASDVGRKEESVERSRSDLGVLGAVVLLLDPGDRRLVEEIEHERL